MPAPLSAARSRGRHARSLLLLTGLAAAGTALAQAPACKVLTEEHGLWALPGCEVVDGTPRIAAEVLPDLPYDADGLAAVYAGGGYHYVRPDGTQLPVITVDNGPDAVVEGLVRGRVGKRIGYFDTHFRQAFPATYDFGWAFDDGVARVCTGCQPGPPDEHGHIAMVGGSWHRIDRAGQPAYAIDPP